MKKYLDLIAITLLVLALTSVVRHYEVNTEISDIIKNVAQKIAPWMNSVIYS